MSEIVLEIVLEIVPDIIKEISPEIVPETYFEERYLGGKRCGNKEVTTLSTYSSFLTLLSQKLSQKLCLKLS